MKFRVLQIAVYLAAVIILLGCGKESKTESEERHGEHRSEETATTIVHLDRHKVYHAGITVETVQKKSVAVPLDLPGRVSFNERRFAHVAARVSGRIEKLYVFTNDRVKEGDVLAELYSQEFLTMQFEFLQAVERLSRVKESSGEEQATATSIYHSARRKLTVVGVTGNDLAELEAARAPMQYYRVRAPFDGTIVQSNVRIGGFVEVGTNLFDVADLSTLWVLADLYEKDLPLVRVGMKALVQVSAYADSFPGIINTIYGVVDEKTRTVKARVVVQNRDGRLKPEMFCTVKVQTALGKETIKIPASALLGETEKHFVFVALNDTTFEKRDVRTGVETREFAEVLDGLLVGEKIAVKGGFFLKSELAKETFGEEH
jgi:Cu(I)/Ag(I) efflux system membrane fusion protein